MLTAPSGDHSERKYAGSGCTFFQPYTHKSGKHSTSTKMRIYRMLCCGFFVKSLCIVCRSQNMGSRTWRLRTFIGKHRWMVSGVNPEATRVWLTLTIIVDCTPGGTRLTSSGHKTFVRRIPTCMVIVTQLCRSAEQSPGSSLRLTLCRSKTHQAGAAERHAADTCGSADITPHLAAY